MGRTQRLVNRKERARCLRVQRNIMVSEAQKVRQFPPSDESFTRVATFDNSPNLRQKQTF
jgi:hypothetical protein